MRTFPLSLSHVTDSPSPAPTVPVARAADYAKTGSGLLTLHPTDPTIVVGKGTKFKTECMERGQLVLPKSVGYAHGDIVEVMSDTELR